jgi:GNAT superfamily N-acetyltransferase
VTGAPPPSAVPSIGAQRRRLLAEADRRGGSNPPPVTPLATLTPRQLDELTARNRLKGAGHAVLRVARLGGQGVGRAMIFIKITADVERAVLGPSPAGFIARLRGGDCALLTDLIVSEEQRGRGIGAVLVRDALRVAAGAGLGRLSLEVRPDNEPAMRLYRRLGFERGGDGDGTVILSRAVAP